MVKIFNIINTGVFFIASVVWVRVLFYINTKWWYYLIAIIAVCGFIYYLMKCINPNK